MNILRASSFPLFRVSDFPKSNFPLSLNETNDHQLGFIGFRQRTVVLGEIWGKSGDMIPIHHQKCHCLFAAIGMLSVRQEAGVIQPVEDRSR
jgi:hypothetical protein